MFLSENYFFDKVLYLKSPLHGYVGENSFTIATLDKNLITRNRIKDLSNLFSNNPNVLGQSTQNNINEEYKIVIIGDSMSYGQGVKTNETFSKVLEKSLNNLKKTKIYNLSISGDDFLDNYTKYKYAEQFINADLYIFTLVDNDLTFSNANKYPNKSHYKKHLSANCDNSEMKYSWLNVDWEEQVNNYYFPSISKEFSNHCIFENGISNIDTNKTIFFNYSSSNNPIETPNEQSQPEEKLNYIFHYYKSAIRKNNGEYFEYNKDIKSISKVEGHPSKKTHKDIASFLEKIILNHKSWK